jgi:molybdopterin-guanine dinucleotide biosynthesis protein A
MQRFIFDLEGFILAGGASRRMGANKAHLTLDGVTFLERTARALRTTARTRIVGKTTDDYEQLCRVNDKIHSSAFVCDVYRTPDGCAPQSALTGLHAALWHARSAWVAIVACDLPFVTSRLIRRLADLRNPNGAGIEFEAVVPVQPDGRRQPLCALYRRTPCLRRATEALDRGEHELHSFLSNLYAREVSMPELADLPGARRFFININTPDEYDKARDESGKISAETGTTPTEKAFIHPSPSILH